MKSLYHYFKSNSPLPSPNGPLSREVPAIAISEANKEVAKVLKDSEDKDGVKRRGAYLKYTPKDKVMCGNYAHKVFRGHLVPNLSSIFCWDQSPYTILLHLS